MATFCLTCYKPGATKKCGRCSRPFCSEECQKKDWKQHGHKYYCGRTGELGKDFEVKDSPTCDGLGLFVKRDFIPGQIILVECPPFVKVTSLATGRATVDQVNDSPYAKDAIMALMPAGGTLLEKAGPNGHNIDESDIGARQALTALACRINHECMPNAVSVYDRERGVLTIKCYRDITAGGEVTNGYISPVVSKNAKMRAVAIGEHYSFRCRCPPCVDPALDAKLMTLGRMYGEIQQCFNKQDFGKGAELGEKSISLMDELGLSPVDKASMYNYIYMAYINGSLASKKSPRKAKAYFEKSKEAAKQMAHWTAFWYDDGSETMKMCRELIESPRKIIDAGMEYRMWVMSVAPQGRLNA